jgi:hypothetical protein
MQFAAKTKWIFWIQSMKAFEADPRRTGGSVNSGNGMPRNYEISG